MSYYIRNDAFPEDGVSQSEISDELAALWIKNGNKNISDMPWPNLPLVTAYFVSDTPARWGKDKTGR